jgi:hypothetical protein
MSRSGSVGSGGRAPFATSLSCPDPRSTGSLTSAGSLGLRVTTRPPCSMPSDGSSSKRWGFPARAVPDRCCNRPSAGLLGRHDSRLAGGAVFYARRHSAKGPPAVACPDGVAAGLCPWPVLKPPCNLQRPFRGCSLARSHTAGARHRLPLRLLAPQRSRSRRLTRGSSAKRLRTSSPFRFRSDQSLKPLTK